MERYQAKKVVIMHSLTLGCASFSGLVPINALVLSGLTSFRVVGEPKVVLK